MTTEKKSFKSSPIGQKGDLRISWELAKGKGHGEWFPPAAQELLLSHIRYQNKEHGSRTHRLETHPGK